jgi:hypothetical protein
VEPEPREIAHEAGLGRGDAEVGDERESEPAAHGSSLDGGHTRQRGAGDAGGDGVEALGVGRLGVAAQVGAGAEVLALAAQHGGPAVGVPAETFERLGQGREHVDVEEVVGRPVDLHEGHVAPPFDRQRVRRVSGHRGLPESLRMGVA